MKVQNKKLSSLSDIYEPYPQIIQNFPMKPHQESKTIINHVKTKIKKFIGKKNARLIIRQSGTENKIRTMSEAKDIQLAKSISAEIINLMKEKI